MRTLPTNAEQRNWYLRTLFSCVEKTPVPDIPGLSYRPNYITELVESELVSAIDSEPWDTSWKRRRQLYGRSYGAAATPRRPIPCWAISILNRLQQEGISNRPFDQMLVNEYLPGQGIALHRDYMPFDRTVVSISLLAPCVMDFRLSDDVRRESILLEPRSILVLTDEARYRWQHGIASRRNDRWQGFVIPRARRLSVTFRLLKQR
jgi:alkylated DNA repair dioxygenase AlkB